jgi:hypothetical protein
MWVVGVPMLAGLAVFAAGCVLIARQVFSRWGALSRRERLHVITFFSALAVFLGALLNFTVFCLVGMAIGGTAVTGKVEGGRYYVANHGRLTEVSREVWVYSDRHTRSTWITHPLAVLAFVVMASSRRLFGLKGPQAVTISVAPDGAVTVGGAPSTVEEAAARAQSARDGGQPVQIERAYAPEAAPLEAVRLYHRLLDRGVVFQTVDRPQPP